jgi:hypothetical protein
MRHSRQYDDGYLSAVRARIAEERRGHHTFLASLISSLPTRFDEVVELHSIVRVHVDEIDTIADIRKSGSHYSRSTNSLLVQGQDDVKGLTHFERKH